MAAFEAEADAQFAELHGHMRKDLEFEAKLTRELMPPSNTTTNIVNSTVAIFEHPEYLKAIDIMREALMPYPEARKAVAQALRVLAPTPVIEHQPA